MSLFGGTTLVLCTVIACGGSSTDDGTGDGVDPTGLGSYTVASAPSQPPTAPSAGYPPDNPNASSSSSTGGPRDGGDNGSSSSSSSGSSSSSSSTSGAPDSGGGGTADGG